MTCKEIIVKYLLRRMTLPRPYDGKVVVRSHQIEHECASFGKIKYNRYYTGSTYSRRWRELRNEPALLEKHGIVVKDATDMKSPDGAWYLEQQK